MIEATLNSESLTVKIPENCSRQHVRVFWKDFEIEMDPEEFAKKCFQSLREWIPLDKRTPGVFKKTYLVTNDDVNIKVEKFWSAWWNGESFVDDRGRQYQVTRWKEIESNEMEPGFYRSKKIHEPIDVVEDDVRLVNGRHYNTALQFASK